MGRDSGVGGMEIVLLNGARVSVDAFVNEKALPRILRTMRVRHDQPGAEDEGVSSPCVSASGLLL